MNQEKRPVSVEDLLRLKRAERPPAEFWGEFDRQLRAKQLAALVEKRPWWHNLQDVVVRARRYQLPLGAAAVAAVTLFVVRDNAPQPSPQVPASDARVIAATGNVESTGSEAAPATVHSAPPDAVVLAENVALDSAPAVAVAAEAQPAAPVAVSEAQGEVGISASLEALPGGSFTEHLSPSARFIAANFAVAQATEAVVEPLLSVVHGFESRGLPARATAVEPLQQMTPPGEARRATRYLAAMVSTPLAETSLRTTERMANRISDEELYDQVHRFGTRRGGFNVKF